MKKNKNYIIYFILTTIIIISILPIINMSKFTEKHDYKKLYNTDNIESYFNYIAYKFFHRSLEQEVIVGKDDYLFLGNYSAQVMHKKQGLYLYKTQDIDKWTEKLKRIQNWYETRGIKFIIVLAPNKHTIYANKLPEWANQKKKTITDDIVNYAKKKNVHILDLRPILKNKKESQLYYITDTHWNNKGASIGYEETIKYINTFYNTSYNTPDYNLSKYNRISGDLANMLKIRSLIPNNYETNYSFIFDKKSNICHGDINKQHELQKCVNKNNLDMGINAKNQYMVNKTSRNTDKLLLLCDSFGTANSQPYNETFQTIWKFHYQHIKGRELADFVVKNHPNIVIYQVVERYLNSLDIVHKLPEIIDANNNLISIGKKNFDIKLPSY